jgi:hypothetical protein
VAAELIFHRRNQTRNLTSGQVGSSAVADARMQVSGGTNNASLASQAGQPFN